MTQKLLDARSTARRSRTGDARLPLAVRRLSDRAAQTMSLPQSARGPIRFGVFEVDLLSRTLRKRGVRIRLQELPFRLLAKLLERPGEVITRDELQQQLWSGKQYGEFDVGLNTAVTKLRHALNDDANTPRYIETIPTVGYKFLAPVAESPRPELSSVDSADSTASAGADGAQYRLGWVWPAAAASLLALVIAVWLAPLGQAPPSEVYRFTVEPPEGGIIRSFGLSPDGRHLAFVVQHGEEARLWLRTLGEERAQAIEGAEGLDVLSGRPFGRRTAGTSLTSRTTN